MTKTLRYSILGNILFILAESIRFLMYVFTDPDIYTTEVYVFISTILVLQVAGLASFLIAVYRFFAIKKSGTSNIN